MIYKIKLFLCILFFSISIYAEANYNFVTTVKLNGVELVNPVAAKQVNHIFGDKGAIEPVVFSECTANYDLNINYPHKVVRLEFFSEVNPKVDLAKVFAKDTLPGLNKSNLKAFLWVYWEDMNAFSETLQVGKTIIKPSLTLAEFKALFPLSYKKSEDHFKKLYRENNEYHVVFFEAGTTQEAGDGPPYDASVQFTFKDGKLYKLAILQGVAC